MDNYKFAVIYGNVDSKGDIKDSHIERYGDIEFGDLNHIDYLMEYISKRFKDVEMFKALSNRHSPEVAAFLISRLGHVVFLNATKNAKKYGKAGIFIMPDQISEEQKRAIYSFYEEVKDYSITIIYDLKVVDGILDGVNLAPVNREDARKLLDSFFTKTENKKVEKIVR